MVPREVVLYGSTCWQHRRDRGEEEQRFYDSPPPPRMDVSVCCLPTGTQGPTHQHPPASTAAHTTHTHPHHHHHHNSPPAILPQIVADPYQYAADQIVPDNRLQSDNLTLLNANHQDNNNWQHMSPANTTGGGGGNTTTYIDYSWLQMQVRLL